MALAKQCDICGVFYEPYNKSKNESKPNGIMTLNIDCDQTYWSHGAIDCCPTCMRSILEHIKYLKHHPEQKAEV